MWPFCGFYCIPQVFHEISILSLVRTQTTPVPVWSLGIIWLISPQYIFFSRKLFFALPHGVSCSAHTYWYSIIDFRVLLHRFMELILSIALFFSGILATEIMATLAPSTLIFVSSTQQDCNMDFLSLLSGWKIAFRQKVWAVIGLTSFISFLSGSTALCCLLSNVWK